MKALAFGFRPLVSPRHRYSALAMLFVCTLLQLIVGAPYAANERAGDSSPTSRSALRGLIVGTLVYFLIGPIFVINAPILVRGGFHPRFLLSLPITLGVSVGASFVPVDGSTLGIVSIASLALGVAFVVVLLLLSTPVFATDEHKALDQSFGLPIFAAILVFGALVFVHVTLTQRYSSPLVAVLLPVGSALIRAFVLFSLVNTFQKFYFEPKDAFLTALSQSAQGQDDAVPPLLGDIEVTFGYSATCAAVIIGNAASVATIVEAMLVPASMAWVLSLTVSSLLEVLSRTGRMQRVELWVAAKLAARFQLQAPMHAARTNALKLVYLHSLGSTGYVAPMMALCIGCLRAVTFGDPGAIVWLDVSQTVWRVLLAQFVFGVAADATVWAAAKKGLHHFELSARFVAGHPLSNVVFRDFDLKGYVFAFCVGGGFIYAVFVAFLGPAFVTGMCHDFAPNETRVWVLHALECTHALLPAGVNSTNGVSS
jgi:hypothetical protein